MRIADLNTSSLFVRQTAAAGSLGTVDGTGKLYKATLEKVSRRDPTAAPTADGEAFVYARSGIKMGAAVSSSSVVLENADGTRFNLDTTGKTVSLVARGQNIDLFVFTPAANGQPASNASAVKYSFNQNGVMAANGATQLSAMELSAAEVTTRRDLDGNSKVGGVLDTSSVGGKRVATAGIFKLNVMGQDLFVVGSSRLDRQNTINAQNATLLNADGTAWSPTESMPGKTFNTFRAVRDTAANEWAVYGTDSTGEVTRFRFDATTLQLKANGIKTLEGKDLVTDEVSTKRDLNVDGVFGAQITETTDAAGRLYKANMAGATVYLSKVADTRTDTTGGRAVSADGSLLKADGTAWEGAGTGYKIATIVSGTKTVGGQSVATRTIYAHGQTGNTADYTDIKKFTFTASGNNFNLDADSVVGIKVDAAEMATAEKTAKRDLNSDGKFGVDITSTVDARGGLFQGSILGKTFYIAGSGLKTGTTGSLANDLAGSLLKTDGAAWAPASGYTVASIVPTTTGGNVTGYTAYAYKSGQSPDRTDLLKYSFVADGSNWKVTADTQNGVKVDAKTLAAAEQASTRDLNGDNVFGVNITATALDASGGLWKGSVFGQDYVIADSSSTLNSSANGALDLSKALLNADGTTAWNPAEISAQTAKLRVIVDNTPANASSKFTVYVSTLQGTANATYSKYTFNSSYTQVGNKVSLTTEEFAAAEKTAGKDLNADSKFGVNITEALDSRGGLYKGSLDGKTGVYFKGPTNLTPGANVAADALNFDTALKTSTGYWTPDTGFSPTAVVTDANANTLTVIAKDNANAVKKYVFDTANNSYTLKADLSGDMKVVDQVALEMAQTTPRDLNGDGITGVQSSATPPDRIGGLFSLTAGGSTVLAVGTGVNRTTVPTDLSTMLQNADGTAWSATGSVDRYTLVSSANDFKVYTQVGANYTEYTFGSDYKIDTTKTRSTLAANDASGAATLDDIKLADLERSLSRDINGDSALGARITSTLVTGKIHQASFNGNTYTVVNTTAGITSTGLGDKALLNADGTRWSASAGMTLKGANINTNASTEVYAEVVSGGNTSYKRLTFATDGKLLKTEDATAEQLADSGALGTLTTNSVDSTGGLFKTTVLGSDYFVVGTGNNNGTAPVDLSRALMLGNTGTAAAWSPLTGTGSSGNGTANNPPYQVGGLVTNKTGNNVDSYDVYAYATDNTGQVTDVFKSTWDASFNYQGTTRADPLALVDVERSTGRDLNKDGAFGFRLAQASSPESTYKGVTAAKVGGSSMTFLLAGTDLNPGTSVAPLSLNSALLNEAGTGAWTPNAGYVVTSVADGAANSNLRYVYTKKAGTGGAADEYMRHAFSTTTGKSQGPGIAMNAQEMAAEELTRGTNGTDLDADGQLGATSISTYKVSDSNSTSTGLLRASYGNLTFFATGNLPGAGAKMNLSNALLKADGTTPWAADTGYTVTGTADGPNGSNLRYVYAKKASGSGPEFQRYSFDTTTNKVVGSAVEISAVDLAAAEVTGSKDFDGDNRIGATSVTAFKVSNNDTSTGLLNGSFGSKTFLIADSLPAAGTNINLSKALKAADGVTPWALPSADTTAGFSVKAVATVNSKLYVYAGKAGSNGAADEFKRYEFDTSTYESLDSGTAISAVDLAALEVSASRDLNGDNASGAISVSAYKVGTNDTPTGLLNASFGGRSFLVADAMPAIGTSIDLGKALKQADGATPWAADAGYTVTAAVTTAGANTVVYARKPATGSDPELYMRYEFAESTGKSLGAGVAVSSVEMAKAELNATAGTLSDDKDLNGDNRFGTVSVSEYKLGNNTTSTGLLQATFGSQTYLVADTLPGASARLDLSKALLQADGKSPWVVASGYTATAAVTSGGNLLVYARKDSGNGAEYQRYTFSTTNYEVQGSPEDVSAVDLAAAEVTATKDLNGDNKVGATNVSAFKVGNNDTSSGLLNASFGAQNFLVVDSMPAAGTNINLAKGLKKADGTAWAIPSADATAGYAIKAAVSTGSGFSVYAGKAAAGATPEAYLRYDFDSAGKTLGAGVAVSLTDMAKTEIGIAATTDDKDLNGDNRFGAAVTVSDYPVYEGGNPTSRSTGLLRASLGGQSFFVVKDAANTTAGLDLKKALLNADGTAWDLPANFVVRGTYENASSTSNVLEVYGTSTAGNGVVQKISFQKQVDANGDYTGAYTAVDASPVSLSGIASAKLEYGYNSNAGADLNGDGVVGFKTTTPPVLTESPKFGDYALDTAALGGSNIYYVTTDYAATKDQASGANIKAGALMVDNGGTLGYWTPPTVGTSTFTLKSLSHTGSGATAKVEVWAEKSTGGSSDGLVRFVFGQVSNNWVLDSAQYETDIGASTSNNYKGLTALQIAAEEAGSGFAYAYDSATPGSIDTTTQYTTQFSAAGRDLNADGVVGIAVTKLTAGSNIDSNVYKTTIDGTDYYLAGTNLSSGTEANPLALDTSKLLMSDATTVWAPSAAVTGWSVLDPIEAARVKAAGSLTNTPQFAATVTGAANPTYFSIVSGQYVITT